MIVSDVASTTLHVQTEGVVSSITYDSNWLWWAGGRTISKQDMNASTGAIKVCIAGQFAQYSALQVVDKNKQPNGKLLYIKINCSKQIINFLFWTI